MSLRRHTLVRTRSAIARELHGETNAEVVDEEVYPAALLSSLPRSPTYHEATTFFSPTLDIDIEGDDSPDAIPSGLSLASRRRIHNRLYMRASAPR